MALPKITHPTFDVTIPITNKKVKVRPMLVKEEKILLMAKQSEERSEQLEAIKQVVQNCIITDNVSVDNIAFFEMEYLFLKIRAASISSKGKAAYRDNEDNKVYNFDIDLDKVVLKSSAEVSPNIDLGGNIAIALSYPPTSVFTSKEFFTLDDSKVFEHIFTKCLNKIYQGDEAFDPKQATPEELAEFVNSIPSKSYEKIQEFFNAIPTLFYEIKYQNEMGTERTITLTTLDDFFTFG